MKEVIVIGPGVFGLGSVALTLIELQRKPGVECVVVIEDAMPCADSPTMDVALGKLKDEIQTAREWAVEWPVETYALNSNSPEPGLRRPVRDEFACGPCGGRVQKRGQLCQRCQRARTWGKGK